MSTHIAKRYQITFANQSIKRVRRRQEFSKHMRTHLSRRRFRQQVQRALHRLNFS